MPVIFYTPLHKVLDDLIDRTKDGHVLWTQKKGTFVATFEVAGWKDTVRDWEADYDRTNFDLHFQITLVSNKIELIASRGSIHILLSNVPTDGQLYKKLVELYEVIYSTQIRKDIEAFNKPTDNIGIQGQKYLEIDIIHLANKGNNENYPKCP